MRSSDEVTPGGRCQMLSTSNDLLEYLNGPPQLEEVV
jgi:hypothetical protein